MGEKKMKKYILLILCIMVVSTTLGCYSSTGRTAGETVDDATITTRINARIVKDPDLGFLKIDVDTYRGNVTLSGTVPSNEAEERLIELANGVRGVNSVKSNLIIQTE